MRSDQYAARVAGFMFLFLIATVGAVSILLGSVEATEISQTFRNVSDNELAVRASVLLLVVAGISTLILAAMLYAVTKHEDRNLAPSGARCSHTCSSRPDGFRSRWPCSA
jgi:ABC-type Fe3+ transport system permease subunit